LGDFLADRLRHTVSLDLTSRSSITQAAQSSLVWAMMIPPHLPGKPRGVPNIHIKIWLVTLISQTEMGYKENAVDQSFVPSSDFGGSHRLGC
jgi:hypothetical protein